MRSRLIAGGLTSALLLLFSSPSLYAHGGQYRGPGDTVPPNLGGGGDITPPGNPGGPGTPGPGAPTTGGQRGPTTGAVPNAPVGGPAGPSRATTGGGIARRGAGEGFERWEFWWEHNKEPFLELKSKLEARRVTSGSVGFLTGRGDRTKAATSNRPNTSDVNNIIVPALLTGLEETHPDIVDSSAIGVGRTLRAEDAAVGLDALVKTLGHNEKTAREAATLGLGILRSNSAVDTLSGLMSDSQDGRRATGKPAGVEDMVRSFAAASLGMIGDPKVVDQLKAVITDQSLSSNDVKAMAILALGLIPQDHEKVVPFLTGLMTDRSLNRMVRAQAPVSLGRLNTLNEGGSQAARAALSDVVRMFQDDKTDVDLLRSLSICIGMLATVEEDKDAIDPLIAYVTEGRDEQTRHFAMMSIAQIGARDEDPQAHPEVHQKIEEFFLKELTKPSRQTHVPYGALGLAVYARGFEGDVVTRSGSKILEAFNRTNNPSYQGAMAVSMGLLNYQIAKEDLWEKFEDSNNQPLQGYIALSLGMMGDTSHADTMRELLQNKGLEFKFKLQLARGLGLMGDTQAVGTLVSYLEEASTLNEAASSAQALGLIGDRTAIDPLVGILNNRNKPQQARGFAAVALGILAEKDDLPWNWRFSVNANYRAKVPALSEILDIL